MKQTGKYYVYIVECRNGSYYTGYTNNLEARIKLHNSGHGAKYLRGRLPVNLVYAREYKYYKNALREERYIKTYSRQEKEKLIQTYEEDK